MFKGCKKTMENEESDEKQITDKETANETLEDVLVTVSQRLAYHKKRGKYLFDRAQEVLIEGTAGKTPLASFLKFDDCASYFYRAAISYRASGRYRESADSLVMCAKMYTNLKQFLEAATLYTEAADIFSFVDKGECVRCLRSAISIYCDAGKFDIAARMERKVALLHFNSKHWEEAAFHFKKASNFLAGEQMLDQADQCLEYAKICFQELNELDKARNVLETLARNVLEQNLRRFNGKAYLFDALLMMIAEPIKYAYTDVTEVILKPGVKQTGIVTVDDVVKRHSVDKYKAVLQQSREYEQLDPYFRVCKECLFIDNIIKARLEWNLHMTADHIYYWNNVRPLGRFQIMYLRELVSEIEIELARRLELRKIEALRKEQAQKRREKRAELRAQMFELGLDPSIVYDAMEKALQEDEAIAEATKTHLTLAWEAHFTQGKKELKRRAKAETAEHMGEFEAEEAAKAEAATDAEATGKEDAEGSPKKDQEAAFSDVDEVSSEDEAPKKKEKKERKRRQKKVEEIL